METKSQKQYLVSSYSANYSNFLEQKMTREKKKSKTKCVNS